jgi:hypothetical protein
VLAHEIGHIRYHHSGYDIPLDQAKQNELEADAFAVELLRRIGLPPLGVTHFFMAATYLCPHRGDFASDIDWEHYLRTKFTHPVSTHRLQILSGELKKHAHDFARSEPHYGKAVNLINGAANQLEEIANILSDYEIQKTIAHMGRTTDVSTLKPVREGSLMANLFEEEIHVQALGPFNGLYQGKFSADEDTEGIPIAVHFMRQGQHVIGKYSYGAGNGRLKGNVDGNTLYFQWEEGPSYGKGVFTAKDRGKRFSGSWGYRESNFNGGYWNGEKVLVK